jgi:hypothetical protein
MPAPARVELHEEGLAGIENSTAEGGAVELKYGQIWFVKTGSDFWSRSDEGR